METFSIMFVPNGNRNYVPSDQVSPLLVMYCSLFRASDRVRQKMGNSAAFSREIMQQERSIMQQIMRFF